jgi:hypothetical protein
VRRGRPGDGEVYRFHHPSHAELLSLHAPVFEQLRAAARLAPGRRADERMG